MPSKLNSIVKIQHWRITLDAIQIFEYVYVGNLVKCIGVFKTKLGVDSVHLNGVLYLYFLISSKILIVLLGDILLNIFRTYYRDDGELKLSQLD